MLGTGYGEKFCHFCRNASSNAAFLQVGVCVVPAHWAQPRGEPAGLMGGHLYSFPLQCLTWQLAGASGKVLPKTVTNSLAKLSFALRQSRKGAMFPYFRPVWLAYGLFIRWCKIFSIPVIPASFSGGSGQRFWTHLALPFSQRADVLWSSLPRLGKQPCHQDQGEQSFEAVNTASLLEGRLLSASCCFTFPALLLNEPYVVTVCLGGQRNRTRRCNGWRLVCLFVCFLKRDT